ncbi:MAG: helix-turn-helix transcriptional regulator [Thermoanaerobaculia bacterium]
MQLSFGGTVIQRRSVGEAAFSETRHDPLTHLARHSHARASFCLVVDGSFREHSARGTNDHGRHDVIFRPARAWHADAFREEGARCFNIEIAEDLVAKVDVCRIGDPRTIARLMRQTRRELRHSADAPLVIEGLLYQIVGEAFQRPVDRSPRWIEEVERIVRTRFRETLTVRAIAEEIGLHPVHVARTFRETRGVTIADRIRTLRIAEAERLLRDSSMPLAEVALCAGFADQSHFTKSFRRYLDVTPLRYRAGVRRP